MLMLLLERFRDAAAALRQLLLLAPPRLPDA